MFSCERCGSRFSVKAARGHEYCPRCLGRDGVASTLGFAPFGRGPNEALDEAPVATAAPAEAPVTPPVAPNTVETPPDQAIERAREAAQRLDA